MLKKMVLGVVVILVLAAALVCAMNWLAPLTSARLLRDAARRSAGLTLQSIEVQGHAMPYLQGGAGEPLLLVHGFTANKDSFNLLARELTPRFRVLVPDLPGFGDATRDPKADYGYAAQVEALHTFVQQLGLKRIHLGGNSMGGGLVAEYAARYPAEVASVWLMNAAATRDMTESALIRRFDATGEMPLLVTTQAQHDEKLAMLFGQPMYIPHAMSYALGQAAIADHDLHRQILIQLRATEPIETRYSQLATPALLVTGALDRIVPPASVQTLAKLFIQHQVRVMPGIGHVPQMEDPKQTASDYLAFRAGLADNVRP
jgi:pimeloyl-ACP methyl ester carboxylesterase